MQLSIPLPKNFQWVEATHGEEVFIHSAFGFVLGFGVLTARSAFKQTSVMRNPWRSTFAWLVWWEIALNWASTVYNFLVLNQTLKPGFWMFVGINILWGGLTMVMLQILCNRVAIIEQNRRRAKQITWGVFGIWMFVIVAILIIWTPAKMQLSKTWIMVNVVWNRMEKVIYLFLDLALNFYFIRSVKSRLVDNGIIKYNRLIKFNIQLICLSIIADVVLIGLMSLHQPIAYMAQLNVTYMIKLNIELSLADLLLIIAREPTVSLHIASCEKARASAYSDTQLNTFRSMTRSRSRSVSDHNTTLNNGTVTTCVANITRTADPGHESDASSTAGILKDTSIVISREDTGV